MDRYGLAEDPDIIAGIACGERDALAALYDRYHRQCYAFALRILGSEGEAEEALQETFIRVWRSAGRYDPARAAVVSWLLSVTRNLCLDELRRRRRRVPQVPAFDGVFDRPAPDRTDEEAEAKIVAAEVRSALAALPGEQRSAIELVYFHGLSSQEVGRLLNVPAPTIRSRLRLGLLKLGGILDGRGAIRVE